MQAVGESAADQRPPPAPRTRPPHHPPALPVRTQRVLVPRRQLPAPAPVVAELLPVLLEARAGHQEKRAVADPVAADPGQPLLLIAQPLLGLAAEHLDVGQLEPQRRLLQELRLLAIALAQPQLLLRHQARPDQPGHAGAAAPVGHGADVVGHEGGGEDAVGQVALDQGAPVTGPAQVGDGVRGQEQPAVLDHRRERTIRRVGAGLDRLAQQAEVERVGLLEGGQGVFRDAGEGQGGSTGRVRVGEWQGR